MGTFSCCQFFGLLQLDTQFEEEDNNNDVFEHIIIIICCFVVTR
jgi:hypothetical protein